MSPSSPRMTRTPAKQSGPIRNSAVPPPRSTAAGSAPPDLISAAGAAVCGALENGVRTAYAVIDDYMRRGQDAARGIFNDSNRRGTMSDERGSFGGGFGPGGFGPGGFNPMNPLSMAAEQWMMAMRAWSQAMSSYMPNGWPMPGMNPLAGFGAAASKVAVKVSSSRPVEVTANLNSGADAAGLVAEPLHAEGFAAPAIEAVTISREQGVVRVSVTVGAKQPAGRYRGLIRTKPGDNVVGDLTAVIE